MAAFVALLAVPTAGLADDLCEGGAGGAKVKLTVHNVGLRSAAGEVAVTVYPDDPRRFLAHHGKLLRARVPAVLPVTSACFWVQPGVYAVAVYHDQNGNHDFDRNAIGMPVEGYGFSNDAPTRFSLPAFDTVRFRVPPTGQTIRVKMRYPR